VTNDSRYYLKRSILRCPKDQELQEFFFSLMDYRNNYFLSKNPKDIIHFYEGFENKEELIDWMKERPKGSCEIKEVEGEKDVVVVIPTADFEGKYAKRCREEIFKGLHIIFVVSGIGNNYFNIAHNSNIGIKKAMEYNPRWIVLSNDDMYKVDDSYILSKSLHELDPHSLDLVLANYGNYHSIVTHLERNTLFYSVIVHLLKERNARDVKRLWDKFEVRIHKNYSFKPKYLKIKKILSKALFRKIKFSEFINFGDFGIFSSEYLKNKNGYYFDENFINAFEDVDLSMQISKKGGRIFMINYRIGDLIGSSLGADEIRILRTIAGDVYFDSKISSVLR